MDNPDLRETHYVRCLKCTKILKCSRYNTNALLEHIRTDHPEIEIIDCKMPPNTPNQADDQTVVDPGKDNKTADPTLTQEPTNQSDNSRLASRKTLSWEDMRGINSQKVDDNSKYENVVYTRRYQVQSPSSSLPNQPMARPCNVNGTGTGRSRSLYRTSIEKWRPASGTIYCPKCGANKRPLIRTESERVTDSSCGAACLLSCWPLCFLPFLTPSNNQEYLHCANCRSFLGLYNRENNCIKPNRDFVDNTQTVTPEKAK